jgi:hypothetical protein
MVDDNYEDDDNDDEYILLVYRYKYSPVNVSHCSLAGKSNTRYSFVRVGLL